jgi:hypothetical protein
LFCWLRCGTRRSRPNVRHEWEAVARREERSAAERERWRETGATVLAQVHEFLTDVHPQRLTLSTRREAVQEVLDGLYRKWESVREPIARLAVGHPSPEARELADVVSVRIQRVFNRVTWILGDFGRHQTSATDIMDTTAEWDQLNERVKQLREALHDPVPG